MAADFLWLWDNINSVWVKAQCDASGNLTISDLTFPSEYPLPAAQVTDLKVITSYPDPVISQTTPENLRHVPHGYYAAGPSYLPYAVDSAGKLLLSIAALQHLSDIADVNLTGLTTGDFIYWDAATSKWERIAHKDATTGVHGAGSNYVALFGAASTVVNRVVWKDASERALADSARTVTLAFTALDLTAFTSATAKLVILELMLITTVTGTAGGTLLGVRKYGTTPSQYPFCYIDNAEADGMTRSIVALLGMDTGQNIDYCITVATGATVYSYIDVLGYVE